MLELCSLNCGRDFSGQEDQGDGQRVAIVEYGLWVRAWRNNAGALARPFSSTANLSTLIGR